MVYRKASTKNKGTVIHRQSTKNKITNVLSSMTIIINNALTKYIDNILSFMNHAFGKSIQLSKVTIKFAVNILFSIIRFINYLLAEFDKQAGKTIELFKLCGFIFMSVLMKSIIDDAAARSRTILTIVLCLILSRIAQTHCHQVCNIIIHFIGLFIMVECQNKNHIAYEKYTHTYLFLATMWFVGRAFLN